MIRTQGTLAIPLSVCTPRLQRDFVTHARPIMLPDYTRKMLHTLWLVSVTVQVMDYHGGYYICGLGGTWCNEFRSTYSFHNELPISLTMRLIRDICNIVLWRLNHPIMV